MPLRVARGGNCAETQVSVLEGKWGRGLFWKKGRIPVEGWRVRLVGGHVLWVLLPRDGFWRVPTLYGASWSAVLGAPGGVWRLAAATRCVKVVSVRPWALWAGTGMIPLVLMC